MEESCRWAQGDTVWRLTRQQGYVDMSVTVDGHEPRRTRFSLGDVIEMNTVQHAEVCDFEFLSRSHGVIRLAVPHLHCAYLENWFAALQPTV